MSSHIEVAITEAETKIANACIRKVELLDELKALNKELAKLHRVHGTLSNIYQAQQADEQKAKEGEGGEVEEGGEHVTD